MMSSANIFGYRTMFVWMKGERLPVVYVYVCVCVFPSSAWPAPWSTPCPSGSASSSSVTPSQPSLLWEQYWCLWEFCFITKPDSFRGAYCKPWPSQQTWSREPFFRSPTSKRQTESEVCDWNGLGFRRNSKILNFHFGFKAATERVFSRFGRF